MTTPRTSEFLIHKDAYEVALDVEPSDKAAHAVVQAVNTLYHNTARDLEPRTSEEYEHLMCYVKLRQVEFLVNYGNINLGAIHSGVDSNDEFFSNKVPASDVDLAV